MNALKIVCEHYDTEVIDKAELTNDHIRKFNEKIDYVVDELVNILWVHRAGSKTREIFDKRFDKYNHIDKKKKEELWNICKDTREKYATLFELLEDPLNWRFHSLKFAGLVGGARAMRELYSNCNLTELQENPEYFEHVLDDDELELKNAANIAQDRLIEETMNKMFELDLMLDT
jgi:hypothetical protein